MMIPGARFVPFILTMVFLAGCGERIDDGSLAAGCVVTAHPLATDVAAGVLQEGGNAVDAAVAASFALAVVEPYSSGLGGGGFFVVHDEAAGRQFALDARETAPAASHRDMFLEDGVVKPLSSRDGALSVAVPSLVRGLERLHRDHGRLPWSRLVQDAERLARDGFPVDARLLEKIADHRGRMDREALSIFSPDSGMLVHGQVLRQVDLARTLSRIRQHGADGFHTGEVARHIVEAVSSAGGVMTLEDLAVIEPAYRDPIVGDFAGWSVVGMPPPSSGGVLLQQMLRHLEAWPLGELPETDRIHVLAEAMSFAFADRSRWLGDPDHGAVPLAMLLDPARIDSVRALVVLDSVYPKVLAGGIDGPIHESDDTTHLSVVDAEGNAVAATLTINLGFGSGMVAPGTGVVLNDEMDDFAAAPGVPNAFGLVGSEANAVAPGKRPLSSMTPTIVLGRDGVRAVCGSPGGSRIITATLQVLLNVLVHGMEPEAAVARPRVHHQWFPRQLFYEDGALDAATMSSLGERGHDLKHRKTVGSVQLIVVDPTTRMPAGASDPRGIGSALVVIPSDGAR